MANSHPVGFRVPNSVHKFYAGLAQDDQRKVGEMMKVVLGKVQGIVAACNAERITPDEILERAGLGEYRTDRPAPVEAQPDQTEALRA